MNTQQSGSPSIAVGVNKEEVHPDGGTVFCTVDVKPGQGRSTRNIALCIDTSASMYGEKLDRAKEASERVVGQFNDEDNLAIVNFSAEAEVLQEAVQFGNTDRETVWKNLDQLETGGGTNIEAGLRLARQQLDQMGDGDDVAKRILLLTDGEANHGIRSPGQFEDLGSEFRSQDGIQIAAAGIGTEYNEHTVKSIASGSDGPHSHIDDDDASKIKELFGEVVSEGGSVTLTVPTLEINAADGVEIGEMYKYRPQVGQMNGQWRNNRLTLALSDLVMGKVQQVTFQIQVPPGETDAERDLIDVELTSEEQDQPIDADEVRVEYVDEPARYPENEPVRASFVDAKVRYIAIEEWDLDRADQLLQAHENSLQNKNAQNIIGMTQRVLNEASELDPDEDRDEYLRYWDDFSATGNPPGGGVA